MISVLAMQPIFFCIDDYSLQVVHKIEESIFFAKSFFNGGCWLLILTSKLTTFMFFIGVRVKIV